MPTNFATSITGGFVGVTTTGVSASTSIRVTDSLGQTFDRAVTANQTPIMILNPNTNLPAGVMNAPYSFTFVPFGGSGT